MHDDPIGDALRADADEARAEIRAAGIICPSCGVNAADLPDDHMLELDHGGVDWAKAEKRPATAKCQAGALIPLPVEPPFDDDSFAVVRAAASVNLLDTFREAQDKAFSQMLGWDIRGEVPPAPKFTGLLATLRENGEA